LIKASHCIDSCARQQNTSPVVSLNDTETLRGFEYACLCCRLIIATDNSNGSPKSDHFLCDCCLDRLRILQKYAPLALPGFHSRSDHCPLHPTVNGLQNLSTKERSGMALTGQASAVCVQLEMTLAARLGRKCQRSQALLIRGFDSLPTRVTKPIIILTEQRFKGFRTASLDGCGNIECRCVIPAKSIGEHQDNKQGGQRAVDIRQRIRIDAA